MLRISWPEITVTMPAAWLVHVAFWLADKKTGTSASSDKSRSTISVSEIVSQDNGAEAKAHSHGIVSANKPPARFFIILRFIAYMPQNEE